MNSRFFVLSAMAIALFSCTAYGQKSRPRWVPGEVLVKIRAGDWKPASEALRSEGAAVVERFADTGWQRVQVPEGRSVEGAIRNYQVIAGVEAVQPNYYYHLAATPNDPRYNPDDLFNLFKISAPQAWDITTGSPSVVVANIDTGSRYTHEDLAANMWTNPGEINGNGIDDDGNGFVDDFYGYDFFSGDGDPLDEHGHGTHTAGTIGAAGNNGVGIAGVNWNVKIMTIKIFNAEGAGATSAKLLEAYGYIRLLKERGVNIRVTNNSYGGCDEACGYDQALKDSIDAMGDAGILNVYAAGNNARDTDLDPFYPASYDSPSVVSVANSIASDVKNGGSNWGLNTVDLAAPGTFIISTTHGSNSSYGPMSGTSMAAPHVTGAAALLAAHNPNLSAASLKATILNSVDVVSPLNGLVKTGGRLNIHRALQSQTVCSFNLAQTSFETGTKGGHFSIDVAASPNCDYAVKSDARWVAVEGTNARSGNSRIDFRVGINQTVNRSANIRVGGAVVTINQTRGRIF